MVEPAGFADVCVCVWGGSIRVREKSRMTPTFEPEHWRLSVGGGGVWGGTGEFTCESKCLPR